MVESHLSRAPGLGGRASRWSIGQSITDACIGWDDSVGLLETLADAVRRRARAQALPGIIAPQCPDARSSSHTWSTSATPPSSRARSRRSSRSAPCSRIFRIGEVRAPRALHARLPRRAGIEIISEGDGGDFMMMCRRASARCASATAGTRRSSWPTVEAGRNLGEMSMIDGEARFATCVAAETALIAVLDRESARAHHRRAAAARRQDPDGAGAAAVAAPARHQRAPARAARRRPRGEAGRPPLDARARRAFSSSSSFSPRSPPSFHRVRIGISASRR